MNLYKELEAETGQGCGVFQPGSLYLAKTENRSHQLQLQAAKANLYGMNFCEVSHHQAEELHPLINFDGIRKIMWKPDGGNVDPSGVTSAYAQVLVKKEQRFIFSLQLQELFNSWMEAGL